VPNVALLAAAFVIGNASWGLSAFAQFTGQSCGNPDGVCFNKTLDKRTSLELEIQDTVWRDHYNISWSTPGGRRQQLEIVGTSKQWVLKNFLPNTIYHFAIQGCDKVLLQHSRCTPWYPETILTCGAKWNPCGRGLTQMTPVHIKSGAGKCLDVERTEQLMNGGRVQVWDCNDSDQQAWLPSQNRWTFRTKNGKCLDVHAPDQNNNGGRVQIWDCNQSIQQAWKGATKFPSPIKLYYSQMCLDVEVSQQNMNGAKVQIWECNGSVQQQWDATVW
jgi:hypothetical protein